jgi:excisionase family DNA binding protein
MTKADVEFTFDQAVRTMGITPERLERMIAEGKIETVQVAGRTRIPRESILEYFGGVSALLPRDKKKLAAQAAQKTAAAPAEAAPEPAAAET